jgi:carbon-monoxide dehydrogenase small subunit
MNASNVQIEFHINGKPVALAIPAGVSALTVIRDYLGLKGTKEGCGIGECGACTIEVDGKAVDACLMLGAQLDGTRVLTVEGLETEAGLHALQKQFLHHHAVQCGFCTPGLLMSAHTLLGENPAPGHAEITSAIAGNFCRCTGYHHIVAAIEDSIKSGDGEAS